eukprot:CAMPEP_0185747884 /NCGR_PEP_ID=MMETSP1174-20130828/6524_1 /TAXON_ID=35687 /ORGANISM="Dictyocha speculum, Strain CCMP1381" /LENGTH=543 /DNA_ID=CAMNT_0028423279 /DNA_START=6 /DNA_END=1634 /DNA_ORIENTATION=-
MYSMWIPLLLGVLGVLRVECLDAPLENLPSKTRLHGNGIGQGDATSWHIQSDERLSTDLTEPSTLAVTLRALYLAIVFGPIPLTAGIAYFIGPYRRLVWYPLLCWAIAQCGAAWIKWAQWASTRPDMFPEGLCERLAVLQTQAPQHSAAHTRKEIENTFGAPLESIFESFDFSPIASASIAQVHRAVYRNITVAVKVRHPKVAERIAIDFRIMKAIAEWMDKQPLFKWLSLKDSIQAFSHTMTGQTWLDCEADHLTLFNRNFQHWHDADFPTPLVSSESVLVETFENGALVSDHSGAAALSQLPVPIAHFVVTRGEDLYLKMLLADGLMHADLHPGNILVDFDPAVGVESARLVLVDAGMVANLLPEEKFHFVGLLQAIGEGDGIKAGRHVLDFSEFQSCASAECRHAFQEDMDAFFRTHCRGYGQGIDLGVVLKGILRLVRIHRVRIDVNYATLVMNALCLDGLAKQILPGHNVMDASKFLLRAHGSLGEGLTRTRFGRWFVDQVALPLAQLRKSRKDKKQSRKLEELYRSYPRLTLPSGTA